MYVSCRPRTDPSWMLFPYSVVFFFVWDFLRFHLSLPTWTYFFHILCVSYICFRPAVSPWCAVSDLQGLFEPTYNSSQFNPFDLIPLSEAEFESYLLFYKPFSLNNQIINGRNAIYNYVSNYNEFNYFTDQTLNLWNYLSSRNSKCYMVKKFTHFLSVIHLQFSMFLMLR